MTPSARWSLVALVAWTLFVWTTRIRNAAADATLSSGGKAFSIGLSVTFVALAVAGVVVAARSWSRPRRPGEQAVVAVYAAWTAVVWAIRVPMIILDDHPVGFDVVHATLGVVSVALAWWAWRSGRLTAAAREAESRSAAVPG